MTIVDYISKKAVLEIIRKCHCDDWIKADIGAPIEALEQNTGRWIDGHCSKCGCDVPAYIVDWKWKKDMDANYCPNCGSYNGGGTKEVDS